MGSCLFDDARFVLRLNFGVARYGGPVVGRLLEPPKSSGYSIESHP